MQTVSAFLFDLDGTLLDTIADLAASTNFALSQVGLPTHPIEPYNTFVGDGVDKLVQRVLPAEYRGEQAMHDRVKTLMKTHYSGHWMDATVPYPGINELLAALPGLGRPFGILSNKPHAFTVDVIAHFFPDVPWAQVWGHKESYALKPSPESAIAIAQEMAVSPESVAFVGDTKTDMGTAVNAGMFPIGVTWGFRDRAELEESGARIILDHPSELLAALGF